MAIMKTRVAVILSGCGVYDGSEIHESVLTLLALDRAGAEYRCVAPDMLQKQVIDHMSGEEMVNETRNVLVEASRIARGDIQRADSLAIDDFEALVFIGGFGAAKNLSGYAFDGADYEVHPEIADLIEVAHAAGKPQGFVCVSPVLAAHVLGKHAVQLTIGNDPTIAAVLEGKGARHVECTVDSIVVDESNRVLSTPAYFLARSISELEPGITRLVTELLGMCAKI